MWPIRVTRSDHVTIWQSFCQNDVFDWPAVSNQNCCGQSHYCFDKRRNFCATLDSESRKIQIFGNICVLQIQAVWNNSFWYSYFHVKMCSDMNACLNVYHSTFLHDKNAGQLHFHEHRENYWILLWQFFFFFFFFFCKNSVKLRFY